MTDMYALCPVRGSLDGYVLNKAGRLVMHGVFDGEKVKVFEADNSDHALFIDKVFKCKDIAHWFPRLRERYGPFLVTDWVEGRALKDLSEKRGVSMLSVLEGIVSIHKSLHEVPVNELPLPQFDYWHDLIFPRFERAVYLMGARGMAESVADCVNPIWDQCKKSLMHPDMTFANIVEAADGSFKLIDNELISVGGLPLLDICNTAYSLGDDYGQIYFDKYIEKLRVKPDAELLSALHAAWLARCVGSALVAGKIDFIKSSLDGYRNGDSLLPIKVSGFTE